MLAAVDCAVNASATAAAIVEDDVVLVRRSFGGTHEARALLQSGIMETLVGAFLVASPVNPRLYRKLVAAVRESFAADPASSHSLSVDCILKLLDSAAMATATESHATPEALAKDDLDLLFEIVSLVSFPLLQTTEGGGAHELRRSLLKEITTSLGGRPPIARTFLEWLSDPPKASEGTKESRRRLKDAIVLLLTDILAWEGEAAAPLLDLCTSLIWDPHVGNAQSVGRVIRALLSKECLAQHYCLSVTREWLGVGTDARLGSSDAGSRISRHMRRDRRRDEDDARFVQKVGSGCEDAAVVAAAAAGEDDEDGDEDGNDGDDGEWEATGSMSSYPKNRATSRLFAVSTRA